MGEPMPDEPCPLHPQFEVGEQDGLPPDMLNIPQQPLHQASYSLAQAGP
jgi:hypothetical protein